MPMPVVGGAVGRDGSYDSRLIGSFESRPYGGGTPSSLLGNASTTGGTSLHGGSSYQEGCHGGSFDSRGATVLSDSLLGSSLPSLDGRPPSSLSGILPPAERGGQQTSPRGHHAASGANPPVSELRAGE